jgi:DNA polymerase-3 subunit beta
MTADLAVGTGMKITCSRDELAARLGVVSRGLSTRGTVQILAGVLLQVQDGSLQLAATDMELSLRARLDANVEGEGSAVVPGRLLTDIVRLLPQDEVVLEYRIEESTVYVSSGSSESRLRTYAVEDFPRLPDPGHASLSTLEAEPLLETIARVSRAASRDESRPVLTGILVRFEGSNLVMAATDSYRMAVKETSVAGSAPDLDAIVPARALDELRRIAAGADEIKLGTLENHVVFGVDDTWLTTRRIDGQFPNYRQLLPEAFEHEVRLPRDEFLDVIRRAGVMAQRSTPLRLRFSEGELTVSAQTQDIGEAREQMPIGFNGEPLEIGFNPVWLRDGIESVVEDELTLKLINPLRPAVIAESGGDFWYLIMPIRLAG